MASQLVRQWLILSLIPKAPPGIDVINLETRLFAAGVAVHRRTIQRDLVELAEVFPLVAVGVDKPYRWRWSEEARFLCSIPILDARDEPGVEIGLKMRVERNAARYVTEGLRGRAAAAREVTCLKKDKTHVELLAHVVDTCTLRRWLLGFAESVEVLSPDHVRTELAATAARVVDRYRADTARERGRDAGRGEARKM